MDDRLFSGFLRMLIARLKTARNEEDHQKARKLLQEILDDLQGTLED